MKITLDVDKALVNFNKDKLSLSVKVDDFLVNLDMELMFEKKQAVYFPSDKGSFYIKYSELVFKGRTYIEEPLTISRELHNVTVAIHKHLHKLHLVTDEEYLWMAYCRLFHSPLLALATLHPLDSKFSNFPNRWMRDDVKTLITNLLSTHTLDEAEKILPSYLPLSDDLYQLRWHITCGEACSYSYLEKVVDIYLGKPGVNGRVIPPKPIGITLPYQYVDADSLLNAKSVELEYIKKKYAGGNEVLAISIHSHCIDQWLSPTQFLKKAA